MRRKEMFCAVIGGMVGVVLVMAMGLFAPLGAQSVEDAVFKSVTCTGLTVVSDSDWETKASISVLGDTCVVRLGDLSEAGIVIMAGGQMAMVDVVADDMKSRARMSYDEHGGLVKCNIGGSTKNGVQMCISGNGSGSVYTWDKQGNRLR